MWNPVPVSALPRLERLGAAVIDFLILLVPEFVCFDLLAGGVFARYARYLRLHPHATVTQALHAAPGLPVDLARVVVLSELVTAVYLIGCVLAFGGTAGKLLLGLRVTSVSGRPLSARDAVLRSSAFWLPALLTYLVPFLGFVLWVAVYVGGTGMIVSRPDRRGLEDFLGRSIVVYRAQAGTPLSALVGIDRGLPPAGGAGGRRGRAATGGHLPGWGPTAADPAAPEPPAPPPAPGAPPGDASGR